MSHSVRTKILIFTRLFTACAALLLLTVTVLQRDDPDGYQAAHLFFMPRQSWEMDEGVGMLHDADYYRGVDSAALAAEESVAYHPEDRLPSLSTSSVQADDGYLLNASSNAAAQTPTLGKMRPIVDLSGNALAIGQTGSDYSWGAGQLFILLVTVIPLIKWLGDTPTPPPRWPVVA
jgi:hypothetical protein